MLPLLNSKQLALTVINRLQQTEIVVVILLKLQIELLTVKQSCIRLPNPLRESYLICRYCQLFYCDSEVKQPEMSPMKLLFSKHAEPYECWSYIWIAPFFFLAFGPRTSFTWTYLLSYLTNDRSNRWAEPLSRCLGRFSFMNIYFFLSFISRHWGYAISARHF